MISEADIERLKAKAEAIAEQVKAERAKAREEKRGRAQQKATRAREIKKLERRSARSTCDVRVAKTRASERAKCAKKKPGPRPPRAKGRKSAARRIKPRPVSPGVRAPEMLGEVVRPKALPPARAPLALLPAAPPLKKRKVSGVRPQKGSAVAARPKQRRRAAVEARRARSQRQPAAAPPPVGELHKEPLRRPGGNMAFARMEHDGTEIELARDPSGRLLLLFEGVPGPPLRGTKRLAGSEITGSKAKDAAIYKEFSRLLGMSKIQRPSANPVEAEAEKARRGFESAFRAASSLIERYARGEAERADAVRAVDALYARLNKPELRGDVALVDRMSELHRARVAAGDEHDRRVRERRDREIAELRAAERAAQPIPGSYEHELAVMRGGSAGTVGVGSPPRTSVQGIQLGAVYLVDVGGKDREVLITDFPASGGISGLVQSTKTPIHITFASKSRRIKGMVTPPSSTAAFSFSLAPTEQVRPSAAKKSAAERTVSMFEPAVMHQRGRRGTLAAPPALKLETQAASDERSPEARSRPMTVEARYDRENDWPIVTINNWAGPSGIAGDVRATWPPNAAEGVAVLRRESGEAVILKGADLHAAMSIALPRMALLVKKELVEEAGPRSIELSDRYDLMSGTKKPAKKRGGR